MAFRDIQVTGRTNGGTVYGSNPYTDDSDFSVAAVHAGILQPGDTKYIRLTDVGELPNYVGTTKNGVNSVSYTPAWAGVYLTLVGDTESLGDLGGSYGYEDWYAEWAGSILKGIDKTAAIDAAKLVTIYYSSNAETTDDRGVRWYGLFRKPDSEGLAYWTKEALTRFSGNYFTGEFIRNFFSAPGPGDLDYNRARSASKSFLTGYGFGDFYDRGVDPNTGPVSPEPGTGITSDITITFQGMAPEEATQMVFDLFATIGRGPIVGNQVQNIYPDEFDLWYNKILDEALNANEAREQFAYAVDVFLRVYPTDPRTIYVLSWRANQSETPPDPTDFFVTVQPEIVSSYVPRADGSTRVLWAGVKDDKGLVSIFSNPKNGSGDNSPLDAPLNHLNRVFFDTRFTYLNIVAEAQVTLNFPFRDVNKQSSGKKNKDTSLIPIDGEQVYTAYAHNLGYTPMGILYDIDNNQAISGNTFLQNIDNTSFRLLYLLADNTNFYIKERYFVRGFELPSVSKSYRVLVFSNPAGVL
jgi:hypothetical protein